MHDPRIGRFFVVDPLAAKFPYLSPYQFAGNKPIWSREIEGLESEVDAKEITSVTGLDYDELEDNYNEDGQELIKKEGSSLNYLPSGTNTCAIRMSEC